MILVRLNCLLSEPRFSGLQDFQDKRLYADVPLQKGALHPGQRNIYPSTPNPGNLGSDNTISNKYSLIIKVWNSLLDEKCKRRNELRDYKRVLCK